MSTIVDNKNHPSLDPVIVAAIRQILDYLWADEAANYLETSPLEGRESHIFNAMLLVDRWLSPHESTQR